MKTAPGAVAALVVMAWGGGLRAQQLDLEAELERGVTLREAGRDAEALEVFRRAWEQGHSPRARAQIAMAEHALGRWVEAHVHLREALDSSDPWIARNRAALRGLLATIERHFGSLEVRGRPAGAEVRVDGSPVGTLPMAAPVRVAFGPRRLEVSAPGYEPMIREITVGAGVTRESVQLAPRLGPAPGARGGGATRALAWVAAGTGAALLAGTAVTFALHESTVSRYNDACLGRAAPVAAETPPCQDDRAAEGTLRTLSTVGLATGAGLGVLAAVLFLVAPSRAPAAAAARVACGAGPGSVGVACGGAF